MTSSHARPSDAIGGSRRVVIGGCGRTGASIAVAVAESNLQVIALDVSQDAFDSLPEEAVQRGDIFPTLADITLESDLRAVAVRESDVFVAVSGNDTINVMAAQIARHMLQVTRVICRLDDPIKRDLYSELDLTIVSSAQILTDLVARRLVH